MTRNVSIDILKGISIFGVVFIHSADLMSCNNPLTDNIRSLFRFSVPCFLIIWSYFIEKSLLTKDVKEHKKYIWKRFIHLFGVFLIWSTLYFLITVNYKTLTLTKLLTTHFSGYGWSGQYYFIILFQLLATYIYLRKIYHIKILRIIVLIVVILMYFAFTITNLPLLINNIGYRLFIYWIPYVFIGIWLAQNENIVETKTELTTYILSSKIKHIKAWLILAIIFIPVESWLINKIGVYNDINEYIRPFLMFTSIIIAVYAIQNNKIKNSILSTLGKKTMTIFVVNPLVIYLLKTSFTIIGFHKEISLNIIGLDYILPFTSTIIVLFLCVLIDKAIFFLKIEKDVI